MKKLLLLACTLFTLTGASTLNAALNINTGKTFKLQSEGRGYVYYNGTNLAGTSDVSLASEFAVVSYDNKYYLYDATNKAFVCHTEDLTKVGASGNYSTERKYDFSKIVSELITASSNTYYHPNFPIMIACNLNYYLNIDGQYLGCFNTYNIKDDGNCFAITYINEEFDDTEAKAMLEAYYNPAYYVTFVVKSTSGATLYTSDPIPVPEGTVITSLPEDFQRPAFYSYNTVNVSINALGNTNVDFTATPLDEPLVRYTANVQADPFYYKLKIRNKYIVYDESVTNELGLEDTEREPFDEFAQWAFIGEPYNGFRVVNQAKGVGYNLLYDELLTGNNNYTDYSNANILFVEIADVETNQRWVIEPNTGGFCMRAKENTNVYFHHQLISGESGYLRTCSISEWSSVHNDEGSTIVASVDAESYIAINETNFPDDNFRAYVASAAIDTDQDGYLDDDEAGVTTLNVSSKNIADLTGIKYFYALQTLNCRWNQLSGTLSFEYNPTLSTLDCSGNTIRYLELYENKALKTLKCSGNKLTYLELQDNPLLETLECSGSSSFNQITELYFYNNPRLYSLQCDGNPLTELDLSGTRVRALQCQRCKLTSLTLSGNEQFIECYGNQLTELDLSPCTGVEEVNCSNNLLTSIIFQGNDYLNILYCDNNKLESLDVSGLNLEELSCGSNLLTTLDLSGQRNLTSITCYSNNIYGEGMQALVESLPTVNDQVDHYFYVIDTSNDDEGNVITLAQVEIAANKNWLVWDQDEHYLDDYLGETEAYAVLYDETTLTFYYDGLKEARYGTKYSLPWTGTYPEWTSSDVNTTIETVSFAPSFANYHGLTSTKMMFSNLTALTTVNNLERLNTENVTTMAYMFYNCSGLTSLDVSGFNTEKVTNMDNMFCNCSGLTSLDVSGFNTEKVTNMRNMFNNCSGLTSLDVSGFNTESVTAMNGMFYNCSGLTSLDVSRFNTASVTNMNSMFYDCSGLTSLDVSGFNTASVTGMYAMFYNCSGLTSLDVSGFNTEKVTNMGYMFRGCTSLTSLDVSSFNTEQVTKMEYMFYHCPALETIYAKAGTDWSTSEKLTSSSDMFYNCSGLVGGNGTTYDSDQVDVGYARIDGLNGNPGYFTYKTVVGDVNNDGSITIADVTALVNIILGKSEAPASGVADVNGDGSITIADVTALVNIILGK